jgi:hypothetical protein
MTDLVNPSGWTPDFKITEKRISRDGPVYERNGKTYEDLEAEIKRLQEKCDKQAKILQAAFPEQSGHYFICGEGGVLDKNGLPEMILISPTFGAGWFVRYDKTEHYGGKG